MSTSEPSHAQPRGRYLALLALTALGVVYGDIGTSPLYALRESFPFYHLHPTPANVLGVLSLVFWSLVLVISIKYAVFVLAADNRGEGGILALTALVTEEVPHVAEAERTHVEALGEGFYRVTARYGFMEDPDVPRALEGVRAPGLDLGLGRTSYFLGRETLIASRERGMARWRERLFALMSRTRAPRRRSSACRPTGS